jgi:hypothetical protein
MNEIINIDGRQHINCLVTTEVYTTNTFGLGNRHSNDDDNMDASNDGGEVQRDNDYHEPNRGPQDVGHGDLPITHITRANH